MNYFFDLFPGLSVIFMSLKCVSRKDDLTSASDFKVEWLSIVTVVKAVKQMHF